VFRWKMPSSRMWCRAGLVRADVSEEVIASIIRVTRISELRTTLTASSNISNVVPNARILFTVMMEEIRSPKKSVLTRATRRHIPEDGILQSSRRENFKSCICSTGFSDVLAAEQSGSGANAFELYSGHSRFESWTRNRPSLQAFCDFLPSPGPNDAIISEIRTPLLISTYFTFHHQLFILPINQKEAFSWKCR
jgi:hypothetical protein